MTQRYRNFTVRFKKVYGCDRDYKEELQNSPVEELSVQLWAENVNTAIDGAWKAVTVTPRCYEIIEVSTEGNGYRTVRYD